MGDFCATYFCSAWLWKNQFSCWPCVRRGPASIPGVFGGALLPVPTTPMFCQCQFKQSRDRGGRRITQTLLKSLGGGIAQLNFIWLPALGFFSVVMFGGCGLGLFVCLFTSLGTSDYWQESPFAAPKEKPILTPTCTKWYLGAKTPTGEILQRGGNILCLYLAPLCIAVIFSPQPTPLYFFSPLLNPIAISLTADV